ncbi:hypothetical protein C1646_682758 [Rhizophagus diaphanus]|nr:hypothetical protein C1646_682758 [Rhizophagus diaphanus] [Rhizophagus sp. MUCL 43196]
MKKTILAIGSTGLGKTTMARLLCEVDVECSSGTKSATMKAIMYETNEFLFIDTRGFDDSSDTTDEEVFHDIMRLFQRYGENNIFKIDAILWFCCESVRELAHLRREARFIQRLIEYTDECKPKDLWNSVLIITKGTFPSHELIDGPTSAAKNACQAFSSMQINEKSFIVKHFPCWICDIKRSTKDGPLPDNYYRQDEIKSRIQHLISNFSPISIHFRQGECQKCNATGDPRLFTEKCHTTLIFNHSIEIEYFHPEQIVHFHSGSKFLDHEPDENSIKNFFEKLLGSNPTKLPASQVSSETAKEIIESYEFSNQIEATTESQLSRMSRLSLKVATVAYKAIQLVVPMVSPLALSRAAAGTITSAAILSAAGTSVLAVCVGGVVFYYETKNIPCKLCKKLIGVEKGCIKKCDNCKKKMGGIWKRLDVKHVKNAQCAQKLQPN